MDNTVFGFCLYFRVLGGEKELIKLGELKQWSKRLSVEIILQSDS